VEVENPSNSSGYFQVNRGFSDTAAQGRAEITELFTVAGRYIPTLHPPCAVIKNICEESTHCPSL